MRLYYDQWLFANPLGKVNLKANLAFQSDFLIFAEICTKITVILLHLEASKKS